MRHNAGHSIDKVSKTEKLSNQTGSKLIFFFAADGLKEFMVGSYEEISAKMEEGTINRTVASTNMNATSSRAHTIVGINFIQKTKNNSGKEMSKGATLNLVDLAGRYEKFKVTKCH